MSPSRGQFQRGRWGALIFQVARAATLLYAWRRGVAIDIGSPAIGIAVVLDLTTDFRFRRSHPGAVAVYESKYAFWTPRIATALNKRGIPAAFIGLRHRLLMQFFVPYNQIMVLVPPEKKEEALAIVAPLKHDGLTRVPEESPRQTNTQEAGAGRIDSDRPFASRGGLVAFTAALSMILGAIWVVEGSAPEWKRFLPGGFAVYLVNDEEDIIVEDAILMCTDVEYRSEPTHSGQVRGYAFSENRESLEDCVKNVSFPPGNDALLQPYFETTSAEPGSEHRQTLIGWRTVHVRSQPLLTAENTVGYSRREDERIGRHLLIEFEDPAEVARVTRPRR